MPDPVIEEAAGEVVGVELHDKEHKVGGAGVPVSGPAIITPQAIYEKGALAYPQGSYVPLDVARRHGLAEPADNELEWGVPVEMPFMGDPADAPDDDDVPEKARAAKKAGRRS